jgi:predicted RND superfamily exporter protein
MGSLSVQGLVQKLAVFIPRAKVYVCGLSVLLIGLSVWGISKLNVETNLMEYFREKSEVYQDARFIDHELGGVNTLEVSFEAKERDAFLLPANLKVIEKIAEYLRERPEIGKVTSINDFLKEMNQSFHSEDPAYYDLPDSREMAAQYLLLYGGDELDNFVDTSYQWARLSARITEHSSSRLKVYIEQLKDFIEKNLGESDLQIRVTGKTYLVNKLVKNIVDSQVQSLSVAFLIIFGMLFIVFRSLSIGFISIIPNMLPIIFNLGLMGLAGIPLNTATAIISAVAIGIAVDDTIHFLNQYQNEKQRGKNMRQATVTAIETKGVPTMTTSLILIGGFGVLVISSFVPTAQFGFLSAMIMLFALISDLLILPAVLLLRKTGE